MQPDPEAGGTCAGDCPGVPASFGAICAGSDDCFPGWIKWSLLGGEPYFCRCDPVEESDLCNGWDDDCDAVLDEDGDAYCEEMTAGFKCEAGFCVECPDRCEGICTDVQTDLQNCGACGNACPASTDELESVCRTEGCGTMTPMSQRLGSYMHPLVDAGSIYFLDVEPWPRQLLSCPLDGCPGDPMVVADDVYYANTFAQDADTVFWSAEQSLWSCPKSGCEDSTLVLQVESGYFRGIHLAGDSVYVTDDGDGTGGRVVRCPKTGCVDAPSEIASGLASPQILVGDDSTLYFDSRGEGYSNPSTAQLWSCPIGGCQGAPTELLAGYLIEELVLVGDTLYFYALSKAAEDEPQQAGIYRCPTSGCPGSPELLAEVESVLTLSVEGGAVHWLSETDEGSVIHSCPASDCEAPAVMLSTEISAVGLAVTPTHYFLPEISDDAQGKLFRAAR